jgi:transglutaminase-like putative cysteine protease/lipoprotein NlpI
MGARGEGMKHLALLVRATVFALAFWGGNTGAQTEQAPNNGQRQIRVASDQFERGGPLPRWVEPFREIPKTQDKAPVVNLLMDTQLWAGDDPTYYVHRAQVANSPVGIDEVARFAIHFNPDYQRVRLHSLHIIRNGELIDKLGSVKTSFLQREPELEQGVYTGDITASILIDDLRVGDVLDFEYTMQGQNPVFGGKYVQIASWDQQWRTENRRLTFLQPVNRRIEWRMVGGEEKSRVQPIETVNGNIRRLLWEGREMPRTEVDNNVAYGFVPLRLMQFSEFAGWADVTGWAAELFRFKESSAPELDALAEKFKQKPTPEDQVSAALSWVQNEVRYFSLSLGESSHRPATPSVTLERRYGDCKDKTALLVELLRRMNIPAQPVLVSTAGRRHMTQWLPSPTVFDHAIVKTNVGGTGYFLDPTRQGQVGKLSAMGQRWEGVEVLAIQPGNDKFTTIESGRGGALTRSNLQEKIHIPRFGSEGEIEANLVWSGVAAEDWRVAYPQLTKMRLAKLLVEPYERRYPGARLVSDIKLFDDPVNNVFAATMKLKSPMMASLSAASLRVDYEASNMYETLRPPPTSIRTQPLALPYKAIGRYTVEIQFPDNVSVVTTPVNRTYRDAAFEFAESSSLLGNRGESVFELKVLDYEVKPERLPAYMAAVRQINKVERGYMYVTKAAIKSDGPFGLGKQTLRETLEQRQAGKIAAYTRSIDGGRLHGNDLAQAYCERAVALSHLGRTDEGLKDTELALKFGPNWPNAHLCRGQVLGLTGNFPQAIRELTEAILLDPEGSVSYLERGIARYYSGQVEAAIEDFAQARLGRRGSGDEILYAAIWQAAGVERLGHSPDAELMRLASADPQGPWPRPALAALVGVLTVDQMLEAASRKEGDEREFMLTEAYFVAGQRYAAQGDKAKAAEYFRKTREQGAITYFEHRNADFELGQLERTRP